METMISIEILLYSLVFTSFIFFTFKFELQILRFATKRRNQQIEQERTQQYITFIQSNVWRKIESLEPILYSPEPNEQEQ